ncbi:MAG: PAS domain S-box protein [Sulfurimonas sp.]|nr:PAS domain S-box protein [Sulfurimonas sp.]
MKKSNLYEIPIDSLMINIIVYEWDGDNFIIIDLNTSAQKTEDLKKELVVGKSLYKIFPSVKKFGLYDVLKRVYKTGTKEILNTRLYEDKRIKGWRKNEVIKLKNGNIMAIYQDFTKEEELKEMLDRVNNFIDSSQTIVFIWHTGEGWPVEYVSNNITDFGYSKDDFLSLKLKYKDIIHKDDLQNVINEVKEYTKNKNDKFIQVYRIITADGSIRWVDDRTTIERDSDGNVINYLGTIIDITEQKEIEDKLKESEEQFRAIAENSLMGIFIYQDTFVYVNPAITEMIGYSAEELYKIKPWEIAEEKIKTVFKSNIKRRLSGEKYPKAYNDIKIIAKNGKPRIARLMTETIKYKGKFAGLGTTVDITDIKNTQYKLKMLAQAIEQTDEMMLITDKNGIITYVNDAYIINSGYKHNELIGKTPRVVKSDMQDDKFYKKLWDTISSGCTYTNILINRRKNKELYHEEITITPIFDEDKDIISYVATAKDISLRVEMEEELNKRANIDSLTGIYNRYRGNEIIDIQLDKYHRYNTNFAILMFDIDYFKNINDTFGHDIGDLVLKKLTKLIFIHMRKSDSLIRWGGEEFIIVSEHLNENKAINLAQKLREIVVSYDFEIDSNLTLSFGVTVTKADDTKKSLLKRVDDALYQAKDSGRNCVKYI